jgi:purine-nucleoside phosphorylase
VHEQGTEEGGKKVNRFVNMAMIEETAAAIRNRISNTPRVGAILGSGLSAVADAVETEAIIPYSELPHFPVVSVEGHSGRLVLGELEGQSIAVMQGRTHYYEGYSMGQITLPIRVMQLLGIEILIVTNAAGGINATFSPGDVMIISDHINLIGMAGLNPLRGPNLEQFGPRFPDMSQVYDPQLRVIARDVAAEAEIPLQEGVYICLAGPSFETVADVRFLQTIGADAVGMSTVPEATVARHGGTRVLGLSGISNVLVSESAAETTHEEVLETGMLLAPRMETILRGVLRRL